MGKREFPDALYIDLLSHESFRLYSASPERLKELIDGNPGKNPVIIDEVQKVSSLLDVVHQVLEQRKENIRHKNFRGLHVFKEDYPQGTG